MAIAKYGFCIATLAVGLAGCQSVRHYDDLTGPVETIQPIVVESYLAEQEQYLYSLAKASDMLTEDGQLPPAIMSERWKYITEAGRVHIDTVCERYISAIFWWNRRAKRTVKEVNLVSTTAQTIMGLYGVSVKEITTVANALGLVADTIDNYSESILFAVEPSGVRSVFVQNRSTHVEANKKLYDAIDSRAGAVSYLQNYLSLCLPSTLEAHINIAVKEARAKIVDPGDGRPKDAKDVTGSSTEVVKQTTFETAKE